MTTIIDYDAGNIKSVENALKSLGEEVTVTRDASLIDGASRLILPGVGAFGDACQKLETFGLSDVIRDVIKRGTPFLGICLGLQLLFEESEESPGAKGLGILPGRVRRFPEEKGLKIPHIGWNDLMITAKGTRLLAQLAETPYVYFVHSYYLESKDRDAVCARASYGIPFDCAIEKDNLFACQFHPEKSADTGMRILKNFLAV